MHTCVNLLYFKGLYHSLTFISQQYGNVLAFPWQKSKIDIEVSETAEAAECSKWMSIPSSFTACFVLNGCGSSWIVKRNCFSDGGSQDPVRISVILRRMACRGVYDILIYATSSNASYPTSSPPKFSLGSQTIRPKSSCEPNRSRHTCRMP
jgi:hypothetical protein